MKIIESNEEFLNILKREYENNNGSKGIFLMFPHDFNNTFMFQPVKSINEITNEVLLHSGKPIECDKYSWYSIEKIEDAWGMEVLDKKDKSKSTKYFKKELYDIREKKINELNKIIGKR